MAKCRLLYQENEELGKMIASGRLAKLEGDLALQRNFSEEMKKSQSELDEFLLELDEDVEGMQSTIYYLQQQLKEAKEQISTLQVDNMRLSGVNSDSVNSVNFNAEKQNVDSEMKFSILEMEIKPEKIRTLTPEKLQEDEIFKEETLHIDIPEEEKMEINDDISNKGDDDNDEEIDVVTAEDFVKENEGVSNIEVQFQLQSPLISLSKEKQNDKLPREVNVKLCDNEEPEPEHATIMTPPQEEPINLVDPERVKESTEAESKLKETEETVLKTPVEITVTEPEREPLEEEPIPVKKLECIPTSVLKLHISEKKEKDVDEKIEVKQPSPKPSVIVDYSIKSIMQPVRVEPKRSISPQPIMPEKTADSPCLEVHVDADDKISPKIAPKTESPVETFTHKKTRARTRQRASLAARAAAASDMSDLAPEPPAEEPLCLTKLSPETFQQPVGNIVSPSRIAAAKKMHPKKKYKLINSPEIETIP